MSAARAGPGDAVLTLRVQHRELAIDPRTSFPRWDGRPVDYDHAVFCLVGQQEAR